MYVRYCNLRKTAINFIWCSNKPSCISSEIFPKENKYLKRLYKVLRRRNTRYVFMCYLDFHINTQAFILSNTLCSEILRVLLFSSITLFVLYRV